MNLIIMAIMAVSLTPKQQALSAIAACEAKGDQVALSACLNEGFDNGLTVSEAKEALSQLYAYTGFPRSLNALGTLQTVLKDREAKGLRTEPGKEADPLPADYDALRKGTEVQTALSGQAFHYTFAPQTDYYLKAHLFGDIFARNNLSHADREIVTVSAIACLPGCEPQLRAHVAGALNLGVKEAELRDIPAVLEAAAGMEAAERLKCAMASVFGEKHEPVQTVDFSVWPKGEPNTAYAQYFVGNSYLAPLPGGIANVTFEPGCRAHLRSRTRLVSGMGETRRRTPPGRHHRDSRGSETLARRGQGLLVPAPDLSQRRAGRCFQRMAGTGFRRAL